MDREARKKAAGEVLEMLPPDFRATAEPMVTMLVNVAPLEVLTGMAEDARRIKTLIEEGKRDEAVTIIRRYGIPDSMLAYLQ